MKANWFLYLPPLLSIYLLLISDISAFHFKNKLANFVNGKAHFKDFKDVIEYITLDWSTRLSFFNSMIAALISSLSIFSRTEDYRALGVTIVLLLVIFIPMWWWIDGHDIDDLSAVVTRRFHIKHGKLCRYVLYVVNIALIAAIYYSQTYSPHQSPSSVQP